MTWQAARDAIATSALYKERPIELLPLIGLVPMGMNPRTKLWEFYDLRSAWDPSGPSSRVYRGGGCLAPARRARSAGRDWLDPAIRDCDLGVRPAKILTYGIATSPRR